MIPMTGILSKYCISRKNGRIKYADQKCFFLNLKTWEYKDGDLYGPNDRHSFKILYFSLTFLQVGEVGQGYRTK
jgi:hypothetical protein